MNIYQHIYQHILFAADFSPQSLEVGKRAKSIAELCGARLSLVHVVEEMTVTAGYELMPLIPELPDESVFNTAKDMLAQLAQQMNEEHAQRWVITAVSTREGILETAKEHGVDLIVVGSHGRHGLALLLGSTANAVLHGAPCDVLAVRIHDE